jgi:hypothetical protein
LASKGLAFTRFSLLIVLESILRGNER